MALLIYVLPMVLVLINSFKPDSEVVTAPLALPKSLKWDNYTSAFQKMKFMNAIGNSLLITCSSVVFISTLSSMCAYVLVRNRWKINTVVYLVMVAAMIVPFQAIMIPLLKIYGSIGMLNNQWTLVFMYIGFGTPFAVFLFHGFIKGISMELEEAATIDGCGKYGVFFKIVLPLLQPIFMTVIILDTLWIWNDFFLPSLVLMRSQLRTLPLSTYYFYGTYTVNYGRLLASLVMTIIPVIVFYLFSQRFIIKGITAGSIK
ncbi:MAG: carbohydrate ABC transporter permease [Spirochaetaceae bacterium]|nr:carbohydrate ABC transporter permease [Spirochaetaceae bacterium]